MSTSIVEVVAEIGLDFIHQPDGVTHDAVTDALRRAALAVGTDGALVAQPDGTGSLAVTHGWKRPGLPPPLRESYREDQLPWTLARTRRGHAVHWSSPDQLPAAVPDRRIAELEGVRSLLALPLIARGEWLGALVLVTLERERAWPADLRDDLRLLADLVACALDQERSRSEQGRAVLDRERLETANRCLRRTLEPEGEFAGIVGRSEGLRKALALAERVAPTDTLALIVGETGTGKELIASAIHSASGRSGRPMVRVNCASLPPTLIESELFGREQGAYTGANTRQAGRFEIADGSTLLLDEIGELPLDLQGKLLRVLEEGQFERLGSSRTLTVDVRVIAATNRDLAGLVRQGRFRRDLFFRVNVFSITVPPLRERPEDIPPLVWAFVDRLGRASGRRIETIPPQTMARLVDHPWPGNVRELKNTIERALILSTGPVLDVDIPVAPTPRGVRPRTLGEAETQHIVRVLEHTGWRVRGAGGASEILGLPPTTLESRMKRLGIRRRAAEAGGAAAS